MKKLTALILTLALAGTAYAQGNHSYDNDDRIEQQIKADPQFNAKKQEAIAALKARGYQVKKIEADSHRGKPVLEVEAYRGGLEYDIIMAYPSLQVISEKKDD